MTIGVGGSTFEVELERMQSECVGVEPIAVAELKQRIAAAQVKMREQGVQALYLDTSSSLLYFTGINRPKARSPTSVRVSRSLRRARCSGSARMSAPGRRTRTRLRW